MSALVEQFAEIVYAALCEAGYPDLIFPAFEHEGVPYLEFDTDDYPEDSDEFKALIKAEKLAHQAIGLATPGGDG